MIVYDTAVGTWASRIWWLFRAFGYDRVAILDGGLTKWKAEGRATDTGHVEPRTVTGFTPAERSGHWVEKSFVEAVVDGDEQATLVCAVPPKEFAGEAGQRGRLGHIPGSVNAPAGRLVSRETNALLPLDGLRAVFADVLASPEPIVTYCGAGSPPRPTPSCSRCSGAPMSRSMTVRSTNGRTTRRRSALSVNASRLIAPPRVSEPAA